MKVLLLSMPDYFEHMPPVAIRMPNGALTSLAGNIDGHHAVAVADLEWDNNYPVQGFLDSVIELVTLPRSVSPNQSP